MKCKRDPPLWGEEDEDDDDDDYTESFTDENGHQHGHV